MKLYFKPGACSLASHIILRELNADFTLESVNTQTQRTESGMNFQSINAKGYVPVLDTGKAVLTEGAVILQYLAESTEFLPEAGTLERFHVQEYLNFVASELHKAFSPFFNDSATEERRNQSRQTIRRHFDYLEAQLEDGRNYLVGNSFSIADAYLFVVCSWVSVPAIDLKEWPALSALWDRVYSRPSVQNAMKAEGLLE